MIRNVSKVFSFLLVTAILCNLFLGTLNIRAESFTAVIEVSGELKEPSAENCGCGLSFFNNTVYSDCYGNQLTGEAKGLYDAFVNAYVTKRGYSQLSYTLETPLTFKDKYINGNLVGSDEYAEVAEIITVFSQIAMDAFIYDHPEVFWLSSMSYKYSIAISYDCYNNADCTIKSINYTPTETYSGASSKISKYDTAVNDIVTKIENEFSDGDSRKEVFKYIHDYICETGYYNNSEEKIVHTSEPIFIGNGGVVCEGYADAFKVICDRLGLPCACVVGMADNGEEIGAHMWNYVQLEDGKWYLIDITWDDLKSGIGYTYFLANKNTQGYDMKVYEEREEQGDFSDTGYKCFVYPTLSRTEYPDVAHLIMIRNSILNDAISADICLDYNEDDKTDALDIVWLKKALSGII